MRRIAYMILRNLFYFPVWFYRIWRMGRADDTHTDQERYDYLRERTIKAVKDGMSLSDYDFSRIPQELQQMSECGVRSLRFMHLFLNFIR